MEDYDLAMFIVSRHVKFFEFPQYRAEVTLRTMPYQSNVHFGHRYAELISGGKLCAYSHTIAVYVSLATGRPGRIPKELAESIKVYTPPHMPDDERRIIVEGAPEKPTMFLPVYRRDIDINNHVNNIRYIEKAIELLPDSFIDISSIRVEYKAPAKLGYTLAAERYGSGGKQYVTLSDGSGKVYSILEFKTA
jgi:acyl-CoA thioesterase FadM